MGVGCCACESLAAVACCGALCLEGSGAADVEGCGKHEEMVRVGPACVCSRHEWGCCSRCGRPDAGWGGEGGVLPNAWTLALSFFVCLQEQ